MTTRKPGLEEDSAAFAPHPAGEPVRPRGDKPPRLAKPTPDPIDLKALHEEISAAFPKTLARLAE